MKDRVSNQVRFVVSTALLGLFLSLAGPAPAASPPAAPAWSRTPVRVDGVVSEFLWNSRYEVAAIGYIEPGAAQASLAMSRGGATFVLAKARLDGIIGWSTDGNILAYVISTKDGKQLLCLYGPAGRTLDTNDIPERAVGKARGGGWDPQGRLTLFTGDALHIRQATGQWEERPFPAGFSLLPGSSFTNAFWGGVGTQLLGVSKGRLAIWDLDDGQVGLGPKAAGVKAAGVNSRGNRVWTISRGRPWRLNVYDVAWRSLGHRDRLAVPEAIPSGHGWRLYHLTRGRRAVILWAWDMAGNKRTAIGTLPPEVGPTALRVSDDDRRLFVLTGEKGAVFETPVPPE